MTQPADELQRPAPELADYVAALRSAVARYARSGSLAALDEAFAAAAGAVAILRGARAARPPEVAEVRWLFAELPEFEQLVSVAVDEADRAARQAGAVLWRSFGLSGSAPSWSQGERERAVLLVACACAPLDGRGLGWLRRRLLGLAADRWAELLARELSNADESVWQHALGARYESVHRRCAPRTAWRTRGLAALLRSDPSAFERLRARLARWLAEGGELGRLADELEAALVHGRTPGRLA